MFNVKFMYKRIFLHKDSVRLIFVQALNKHFCEFVVKGEQKLQGTNEKLEFFYGELHKIKVRFDTLLTRELMGKLMGTES